MKRFPQSDDAPTPRLGLPFVIARKRSHLFASRSSASKE